MLNALLELHEIRPAMIAERDRGEDDLATADLAEVDDRAVARDVPGRLQPLRSGEARAWRQADPVRQVGVGRSEEHTSELQSLMRISYAVFCLKQKKHN